jgi:hypothetical protein
MKKIFILAAISVFLINGTSLFANNGQPAGQSQPTVSKSPELVINKLVADDKPIELNLKIRCL